MHSLTKSPEAPIDLDFEHFGWSLTYANNNINEFNRSNISSSPLSGDNVESFENIVDQMICHIIFFTLLTFILCKAFYESLPDRFNPLVMLRELLSKKIYFNSPFISNLGPLKA